MIDRRSAPVDAGTMAVRLPVVTVRVAVVRGDELRSIRDLVADGRDVVLPAAATEEAERPLAVLVAVEDLLHVPPQGILRAQRLWEVEQPRHPEALGNCLVELLDVGDADRIQHLALDAWDGVWNVGMDGPGVAHVNDLLTRTRARSSRRFRGC